MMHSNNKCWLLFFLTATSLNHVKSLDYIEENVHANVGNGGKGSNFIVGQNAMDAMTAAITISDNDTTMVHRMFSTNAIMDKSHRGSSIEREVQSAESPSRKDRRDKKKEKGIAKEYSKRLLRGYDKNSIGVTRPVEKRVIEGQDLAESGSANTDDHLKYVWSLKRNAESNASQGVSSRHEDRRELQFNFNRNGQNMPGGFQGFNNVFGGQDQGNSANQSGGDSASPNQGNSRGQNFANMGQSFGQNFSRNPAQNPVQNPVQNSEQNPGQNSVQNPGQNRAQNSGQNPGQNSGQNPGQNFGQNFNNFGRDVDWRGGQQGQWAWNGSQQFIPGPNPTEPPIAQPVLGGQVNPQNLPTPSKPVTNFPTSSPLAAPTTEIPTKNPTKSPSTDSPTKNPTKAPNTGSPTKNPTKEPTSSPLTTPTTEIPTKNPTKSPSTGSPTKNPTKEPTSSPLTAPTTEIPTKNPTKSPSTDSPTKNPTKAPTTGSPTKNPTKAPTTGEPTNNPTKVPTTGDPTKNPTKAPTTDSPTKNPTKAPTTDNPTKDPTRVPTKSPTVTPSQLPTLKPTPEPTSDPTPNPTSNPTLTPTLAPTTERPTKSLTGLSASQPGSFSITLRNMGSPNKKYDRFFLKAKERWEAIVINDLPDIAGPPSGDWFVGRFGNENKVAGPIDDIMIGYKVDSIDGIGGTLGEAGPTFVRSDQEGILWKSAIAGTMNFDKDDFEGGEYEDQDIELIILHEMGHCLGIGTFWVNNCGAACFSQGSVAYTCDKATTEFANLGVPGRLMLESEGGGGTACSHWNENSFSDLFSSELMTGTFEPGKEQPLSRVSAAALEDLGGYEVNYEATDPYPAGLANLKAKGGAAVSSGFDILRPTNRFDLSAVNEPGLNSNQIIVIGSI